MSKVASSDEGSLSGPSPPPDATGGVERAQLDTEFDPRVVLQVVRDGARVVDFVYANVNAAAANVLRLSPNEVIGMRLSVISPSFLASPLGQRLVAATETGAPLDIHGLPHRDRDGRDRVLDVRAGGVGDVVSLSWRDVTDESLLERRYRIVAEHASDGVLELDEHAVITWASPSCGHLFGLPLEEIVGRDARSFLDPSTPLDDRAVDEMLSTSLSTSVEVVVRHADGRPLHVAVAVHALRDEIRDRDILVASLRMIDDVVRERQRFRELADRYELLAHHSTDVVILADPDGTIRWIFDTVTNVLGWTPEEMIGRRSEEFIHPDDLALFLGARDALLRTEAVNLQFRARTKDGAFRWIEVSGRDIPDASGRSSQRIVAWRDAEEAVRRQEELAVSEARFRLLAENASGVVVQTSAEGVIEWVSPSVVEILGWNPNDMVGRPMTDFNDSADVPERLLARQRVLAGELLPPFDCRYRTRSGRWRWMSVFYRPIHDASGATTSIVSAMRDIQGVVVERRAHNALAAGNAVLAVALDEHDLISQLCQTIVDQGGYRFAWYGRRHDDRRKSISVVAASKEHRDYLDGLTLSWDDGPHAQGPTGRAARTGRTTVENNIPHSATFRPWLPRAVVHGFASSCAIPVAVGGAVDGVFTVYDDQPDSFPPTAVSRLEEFASRVGAGIAQLRERERLVAAEREGTLLTTAMDQAVESIITTTLEPRIIYANPAASRVTGYSREEMIGQNPHLFSSGEHDEAFYRELWGNLVAGRPWQGILTNRRKDGQIFDEDATVSPVHDADGTVFAYVAVKRDLSHEQGLATALRQSENDAEAVSLLMREVRASGGLAATAQSLCDAVAGLDFVTSAALYQRDVDGGFSCLATRGSMNDAVRPGLPFPFADHARVADEVRGGAWIVDLEQPGDLHDEPLVGYLLERGMGLAVMVPVRDGGELVGILATTEPRRARTGAPLARRAAYDDLGGLASALVGPMLAAARGREVTRRRIRSIIERREFSPVFQPIVHLATGELFAFEALTRFRDGTRPDLVFEQAREVGLGRELELACVEVAIEEGAQLPPDRTLGINFSADSLDAATLRDLRARADRDLAVEVTEHTRIDDPAEVRRIVSSVEGCRLAVDDAGAGFAGLQHILELSPDTVKLDIALVHDVDRDPVRQALVSGMRHFGELADIRLIAEGVETAEEAHACRELGIDLAQGYYFAHPAPAATFRDLGAE